MDCRITVSSHCQDLTNCMYQLQQKGLLCDAGLECKDGVVYIHKLVLLSCDIQYFYHQVPTGTSLSKCYIDLRNFTLRSVCGLVQILYTGRLRLFRDYLNEFIELCSFLGLVRIKAAVQSFLGNERSALDSGQNTSETNQGELPCIIQSTESYFYPGKVPREKTETDDVVDSTSEIGQVGEEDKDEFDGMDRGDNLDRVESVTGTDVSFIDKDEKNDSSVIQNVKPTIMEKQAIHQSEASVVPVNMINLQTRQNIAVNCDDANNVSELFLIAKQLSTGSTDNNLETAQELASVTCTQSMDVVEDIKPDRVDCRCSMCNQMFNQEIQKINAQEKLVCEHCRGQEDRRTETLEEVQLDQIEQSANQTCDSEDQEEKSENSSHKKKQQTTRKRSMDLSVEICVEAKKAKGVENRKKREILKEIDLQQANFNRSLVQDSSDECAYCKRLEKRIDGLSEVIGDIVNSRDKKSGSKCNNSELTGNMSPQPPPVETPKITTTAEKTSAREKVPTPQTNAASRELINERLSRPQSSTEDTSVPSYSNLEECFVGNPAYKVVVKKNLLERAMEMSKTGKKFALCLISFVLTRDEIETCTIYGNKQFNKAPLAENKREAIKSQIFSIFFTDKSPTEKFLIWEKLVIRMNDKIRGIRAGKYKDNCE